MEFYSEFFSDDENDYHVIDQFKKKEIKLNLFKLKGGGKTSGSSKKEVINKMGQIFSINQSILKNINIKNDDYNNYKEVLKIITKEKNLTFTDLEDNYFFLSMELFSEGESKYIFDLFEKGISNIELELLYYVAELYIKNEKKNIILLIILLFFFKNPKKLTITNYGRYEKILNNFSLVGNDAATPEKIIEHVENTYIADETVKTFNYNKKNIDQTNIHLFYEIADFLNKPDKPDNSDATGSTKARIYFSDSDSD